MLKTKSQSPFMSVKSPSLNRFLWLVVMALFGAGVVANQMFVTVSVALRIAAWVILSLICLSLAAMTVQGSSTVAFAKEAWLELKRVVWPEKQETVQTTLIVMAMVILVSIIIWIVDSGLLILIGILTGQRG